MSLKVHQTDELHSPHIHSLKPFPSVVLVNHFPSPVPANLLSFICSECRQSNRKEAHLAAGIWPESAHQTFFCTRKTLSARAIESFSFSLWSWVNRVASRAWPPLKLPSMLVCWSKTKFIPQYQKASISNAKLYQSYLFWFGVVVLLAEKTDNLLKFDQLLQSQLFILPAWEWTISPLLSDFLRWEGNWTEWNWK